MSDANKPSGSTSTYKAMLTNSSNRLACSSAYCTTGGLSEHIEWVFLPNTNYYRRDGSVIVLTTNAYGILGSGETLTNQIWLSGLKRFFRESMPVEPDIMLTAQTEPIPALGAAVFIGVTLRRQVINSGLD